MNKGISNIVGLIIAAVLLAGSIGGYVYFRNQTKPIACTTDAKQCPDGSAVGRTGPKCEFAECPTTTIMPLCSNNDYKTEYDKDNGLVTLTDDSLNKLHDELYKEEIARQQNKPSTTPVLSQIADLTCIQQFGFGESTDSCVNTDLSPINSLSNLKLFYLYGFCGEHIEVIEGFRQLQNLGITSGYDLSYLKTPKVNLTELGIGTEFGGGITPEGVLLLNEMAKNQILPNLKSLSLYNMDKKVSLDLSGFKNVPSLEKLVLVDGKLGSFKDIKSLNNLKNLLLQSIDVSDISDISSLTKLEKLTIAYCDKNSGIKDLKPISYLVNLKELHITDCYSLSNKSNINSIKSLVNLESFTYSSADIPLPDISVFTNMPKLSEITIQYHPTAAYCQKLRDMFPKATIVCEPFAG